MKRVIIKAARTSSAYQKAERRNGYSEEQRNPKFSERQMYEIREGLKSGVDVSLYADPKFDDLQMYEIRKGLESGVDVSLYADPKFGNWQMKEIRKGLESGVDVSIYANLEFSGRQMEEIRKGLESGVDVSSYADPKFSGRQMEEIRERLEQGLPSDYDTLSKNDRAKARWDKVKQAIQSRRPLNVEALEAEFDLTSLEGRGAYLAGLNFDQNEDGSITFTDNSDLEVGTISVEEFDSLVKAAIANSSTRSSFAKAFATQLKHEFR